jgi:hypothetical protein
MEGTTAAELSSPEMRDNCAAADGSSHVVPLSSTRKQKRLHQTTRKVSTSKCEQRNGTAEQEENKMRDGQQQQSTPLLASSRHRSGQGIYKGKKELGTFSRTDKRITRIRAPFLGGSPIPDPPRRRKPPKPVRRRSTEARLDSGSAAACASTDDATNRGRPYHGADTGLEMRAKATSLPSPSPSRLPRRRRHGPEVGDDGDNYSCAHHVPTHWSALLPQR